MEKILERAIIFAYRKATGLGADSIEAFETALSVLFDARPDLEESDARMELAGILAAVPPEDGGSAAPRQ